VCPGPATVAESRHEGWPWPSPPSRRDRGDVAEGADGGPSLHLHVVIASETVERSLDISPEPTCAPL
jgi:hypothetical protein